MCYWRCWRFMRRAVLVIVVAIVGTTLAQAQPSSQVTIPQRGKTPAGFYSITDIETIDTASGNLSLRIPITSLPGARTETSASVDLIYNSAIYAWYGEQLVNSDFISPVDSGGWRYSFDYTFTNDYIPFDFNNCNSTVNFAYFRYRLVTPDGASHVLYIRGRDDDWRGYYPYPSYNCGNVGESGNLTFYTADAT